MTYDPMTVFVKMRGEGSLAELMHKAKSPQTPKRDHVRRPGNRKGTELEHIKERMERVRKFKGIFSRSDVAKKLAIGKGAAGYLVRLMVKKRVLRQAGESKYEVNRSQNA